MTSRMPMLVTLSTIGRVPWTSRVILLGSASRARLISTRVINPATRILEVGLQHLPSERREPIVELCHGQP